MARDDLQRDTSPAPTDAAADPSSSAATTARALLDPSRAHLLGQVELIRRALERIPPNHEAASVAPRHLVIPEDLPERLPPWHDAELGARHVEVERLADEAEASGVVIRLRRLGRVFGLHPVDLVTLVIAAAPDLDPATEPLLAAAQSDPSLRRATRALVLHLTGLAPTNVAARTRIDEPGPLVRHGLLEVDDDHLPWLARRVRVPDRVVQHLLGGDVMARSLASALIDPPAIHGTTSDQIAGAIRSGTRLVYVHDRIGGVGTGAARAAIESLGGPAVIMDLAHQPPLVPFEDLAREAAREATLRGGGLVVASLDRLLAEQPGEVALFTELDVPVALVGRAAWDPATSRRSPLIVEAERASATVTRDIWRTHTDGHLDTEVDLDDAIASFRLSPEQAARAAISARAFAGARGERIDRDDLQRGAREQNASDLERLARRLQPRAEWSDLVLPPAIEAQVRDLAARWRHRDTVLDTWGLNRAPVRGRGVSALFTGPPGTGKTLSAEVLAGAIGLDLYVIELSTVIDKYIGETSKNLERIFSAADRVNGVLLFDEADALFGKRSAVSDAKDRHANVEVAYLLQRMESFDGIAILTSNLAANLDEAFLRRLDAIVDFPEPDEAQRRMLWAAKLPPTLPVDDDVDVDLLAARFRLSGSEILNAVTAAAYRAADEGRHVGMRDLVAAVVREHRKLGRHLSAADLQGLPTAPTPGDGEASRGR